MQSTIKYNCPAVGNGIIKADVIGLKQMNPSITALGQATLTVNVNAAAAFTANIYKLPTLSVPDDCVSCHRLYQKSFAAGANAFTVDVADMIQNTANGSVFYIRVSPLADAVFEMSGQVVITADASRPSNAVRRQLPTDARVSFDLGKIGTASVNLRDGNLSFSHADWVFGGGKTAFSLAHIYNGASCDTDEIFSDIHSQTGKGWKTNFHQYLAGNDKFASYVDACGTEHFFDQSNGKIYDTSGLGLFLQQSGSCKKLVDADGNAMMFSPTGMLCRADSTTGNSIFVGYEDSGLSTADNVNDMSATDDILKNSRIAYIQNGTDKAVFTYQNNLLSSVSYDGAAEKLSFAYDGGRLTEISKTLGNDKSIQAQFEYDNGRLSRIFGNDYIELRVSYGDDGKVQKVSSAPQGGQNRTAVSYTEFIYEDSAAYIINERGVKFKYVLKPNGDIKTVHEVMENGSLTEVYPDENGSVKTKTTTYIGVLDIKDIRQMQNLADGTSIDIGGDSANTLSEQDILAALYSLYKNNGNTLDFVCNDGRTKVCSIPNGKCKLSAQNGIEATLYANSFKKETVVKDDSYTDIIKTSTSCVFESPGQKLTTITYALSDGTATEMKREEAVINHQGLPVKTIRENITTTYSYDDFGNLTSTITKGADNSTVSTSATYSEGGENQTSFTDETGVKTEYTYHMPYNILNELTHTQYINQEYTYDAFKENLSALSVKYDETEIYRHTISSDKNRVATAECGNSRYDFVYNQNGELSQVKECNGTRNTTLFDAQYVRTPSSVSQTVNYTSGGSDTAYYDKYGNLSEIKEGSVCNASFTYKDKNGLFNSKAKLQQISDHSAGITTTFPTSENQQKIFETTGTLNWKKENLLTGASKTASTVYSLDNGNDLLVYNKSYHGDNKNTLYVYNSLTNTSNFFYSAYTYDSLKRISAKRFLAPAGQTGVNAEISYGYIQNNAQSTHLIACESAKTNDKMTSERCYSYNNGNLSSITITKTDETFLGSGMPVNSPLTINYEYDDLNRISKEVNPISGNTTVYTYDAANNITKKTVNGTEHSYTYQNGLLTNYNGQSIVYSNGYPSSYRGYTLNWRKNRLVSYVKNGTVYNITYDVFGRMVKKQAGNAYWLYFYDGNTLVSMEKYIDGTLYFAARYLYDNEGIFGMKFKSHCGDKPSTVFSYYITKDAFGNVVQMDGGEGKVLEVEYDAFGKPNVITSKSCGGMFFSAEELMPFRFRGYFYESDLDLYYLLSRYYDPETGRFISPDNVDYLDPTTAGGLNLYAYCGNDPVNRYDPTGHFAISLLAALLISFTIGTSASAISQYIQYNGEINWIQASIDGLFAVASIALAYTGIGLIGSVLAGAGMSLAQYTFDTAIIHNDFTWSGALIATGLGALGGLAGGRGAQHFKSIGKNLDATGRSGVKAILTTFNKYGKGSEYQNILNLWGGRVATSFAKSISQNFTKSALTIFMTTALTYTANYYLNKINWNF